MVYLITYDLHRPGQNYTGLHLALKGLGEWAHPLESVWLVNSSLSATDIYNRLAPEIDKNDNILVTAMGRDHQGWLPAWAWTWINSRVYA